MFTIRGDYYRIASVKTDQAKYLAEMKNNLGSIDAVMNSYKATKLLDREKEGLVAYDKAFAEFTSSLTEFEKSIISGDNDGAMKLINGDGRIVKAREGLGGALSVLMSINDSEAERLRNEGKATEKNRTLFMYVIGTFGTILGLVIAFFISGSLVNGILGLVNSSLSMSKGDLMRDSIRTDDKNQKKRINSRKDEIGDMGNALRSLITYLQGMGDAAIRIADNDLSINIQPISEKDELGNAFRRMVTNLRETVSAVAENAITLGAASKQLAEAASQAGQVTGQIAATIQEVAKGTTMNQRILPRQLPP
jgi:methyl-accepting chemotaxis protein